jgi:4-cresol dehydrogenase (hydroxylating)
MRMITQVLANPRTSRPRLDQALAEWQMLLGEANVLTSDRAADHYGANTEGIGRRLVAALVPQQVEDVAAIIRIAARQRVPIYPVSTGRNWGYGSALPVTDGCALVDLSRLNRIVEFDADLGLVTVEPGVTQRQLAEYLDRHRFPYMVPVTGAGPDCSLLGNALERGYGLTPHADHFGGLTALEAILPDGSRYRSALAEMGGDTVNRAFKWGVGPYLDGLFAQGNFGIVTQATLALAPLPERVEGFFFTIPDDRRLEGTVAAVQEVLRALGSVVGGINLMNARRLLAMLEPYPRGRVPAGRIISDALLAELARRHGVTPWVGVGALYGPSGLVRAARAIVRDRLRSHIGKIAFLTPQRTGRLKRLASWLPGARRSRWFHRLDRLDALLRHLAGRPSDIALPLPYWKSGTRPRPGQEIHPARDGCGLLWYAPLVPMVPQMVRAYVETATRICTRHGMESLLTLTSLSDRCFDSTIPLLFDARDSDEAARAHACHAELMEAGQAAGFLPYRLGVYAMRKMVDADAPFWRLAGQLKNAIDPHHILAPARYTPEPRGWHPGIGLPQTVPDVPE